MRFTQEQRNEYLNQLADDALTVAHKRQQTIDVLKEGQRIHNKLKNGDIDQAEFDRQATELRKTDTDIELTDDEYDFIVGE